MREIRLHGRGGQGVVMASAMLCSAFIAEGKYASSFGLFGAEPRGAPVTAFVRFGSQIIREKTQVYYPECLIIADPPQAKSPLSYSGLKPNGVLILNSPRALERIPHQHLRITGIVDATRIALDELGMPITSTCMLGAFAGTTGWLSLESVLASVEQYFKGGILTKNIRSAERGFKEVKVTEW